MGNRFRIFIWTLFDFANTSFSILILTTAYSVYFREVVVGNSAIGDFLWGLAFSISMFVVALISPFLGAIADHSSNKKFFLFIFTYLCIVSTGLMFFVERGDVVLGMVLLILANIGFEGGLVFYDAFLPEITSERSYGRVSGYGFAMGYVGSFASLLFVYPFLKGEFTAENMTNVRLSFVIASLFFFVFSLPGFNLFSTR
ncbi:effluxer Atg22 like [Candidatus Kryptonium thompsonii]|uniref:Effluxer Atg22 like n=1 Tax=Candidatus Kryptonium thompsonii TaxID=1633631 RepID=A0ABM9UUS3_9BACT|nr:MFS transporter [Candidatus Kryptonium thompsoni]CUS83549.1 effluxer Atg22 like [Candidatus Kryptonium thompsoni]